MLRSPARQRRGQLHYGRTLAVCFYGLCHAGVAANLPLYVHCITRDKHLRFLHTNALSLPTSPSDTAAQKTHPVRAGQIAGCFKPRRCGLLTQISVFEARKSCVVTRVVVRNVTCSLGDALLCVFVRAGGRSAVACTDNCGASEEARGVCTWRNTAVGGVEE